MCRCGNYGTANCYCFEMGMEPDWCTICRGPEPEYKPIELTELQQLHRAKEVLLDVSAYHGINVDVEVAHINEQIKQLEEQEKINGA
jgi:hypothetical protein